jgi:ABC-type transporter Mla MlaB component
MAPRTGEPVTLDVDVARVAPDAATLDALARLALIARRNGCGLRVRHAPEQLLELIELAGLSEVLAPEAVRSRSTKPRC